MAGIVAGLNHGNRRGRVLSGRFGGSSGILWLRCRQRCDRRGGRLLGFGLQGVGGFLFEQVLLPVPVKKPNLFPSGPRGAGAGRQLNFRRSQGHEEPASLDRSVALTRFEQTDLSLDPSLENPDARCGAGSVIFRVSAAAACSADWVWSMVPRAAKRERIFFEAVGCVHRCRYNAVA